MKLAFGVIYKKTLPISVVQSFPPSLCSEILSFDLLLEKKKSSFFFSEIPSPKISLWLVIFRCQCCASLTSTGFNSLKSSSFRSPKWFFLKVVLTIPGFSHFYMDFYVRSPVPTGHPAESSPKVLGSMDCFWVEWTH